MVAKNEDGGFRGNLQRNMIVSEYECQQIWLSLLIDFWGTAIRDIRAGTAIIVVSLGIQRALWRVDCVNSFFHIF